jgi:hypothetical protein
VIAEVGPGAHGRRIPWRRIGRAHVISLAVVAIATWWAIRWTGALVARIVVALDDSRSLPGRILGAVLMLGLLWAGAWFVQILLDITNALS